MTANNQPAEADCIDASDSMMPLSKRIGLFASPLAFLILLLIPAPEALGEEAWKVIAVAVLMLGWWVTEAVPIPVTALTPIITLPALGIMPIKQSTSYYGHPIVFLFLGGFMLALALEKWRLHLRIALFIVRLTGTKATQIIFGFMLATAFLSMWVSNTATTVLMLPIATSVLALLGTNDTSTKRQAFSIALLLAIAFAANIGGTATIIGTPPNAIFAGFLTSNYGIEVDFMRWFMVGFPFMACMLVICWLVIVKLFAIQRLGYIDGAGEVIESHYHKLGRMSKAEWRVGAVFVTTACLWMFKKLLPFDGITDTTIAIGAAVSFFLVPVNFKAGQFLLSWDDTKRLPWGILLLFGGGLNLAGAMGQSGLVQFIGEHIATMYALGLLALMVVIILTVIMLTECMSNLALITVMLPVIVAISVQLGLNPMVLCVGATLAASCAFMLPMATPPNAIVFSGGGMRVVDMMKVGIWLNIISMVVIVTACYTLIPWVFDSIGLEHFAPQNELSYG